MKRRAVPVVLLSCLLFSVSSIPAHAEEMVSIKGAYGASSAFETDKYIWKSANANYQEKNWQYLYGPDRVNTYDKRIFDRYDLEIQTHTGTPWNAYTEIKVDPWSFVGVAHETLYNGAGWNDSVQIKHLYWEATGKTIPQTYRTFLSNAVQPGEVKVIGGRLTQATAAPAEAWVPVEPNFTNFSNNNSAKIDYMFRPIRKLWVDYKEDPVYVKTFFLSDQSEALTSDDPLNLSNNHVYWAPSPWIYNFDPGMRLSVGNGIQSAKWNWDLPWYAQDSNRQFLTFLRGGTFGYNFNDVASLNVTAAAPMSLWDDFDAADNIPIAARFKMDAAPGLDIGSTYTSRYGIYKQDLHANSQVLGFDFDYDLGEDTHLIGEYAASHLYMREIGEQQFTNTGYAYVAGIKKKHEDGRNTFSWDTTFTNMSRNFAPALADYRDTREDRDWGRHIWFDPIGQEDAAIRIGDSVDVNRYVVGASARATISENLVDFYLNCRNVHNSYNNKFIENVTRFETTYNPLANVQLKGLFLNRARPLTNGGQDPWIYDRYWDVPYVNGGVQDGQNADLYTISGGAKVDLYDNKLTIYGIYEATNDPQEFPRREVNFLYNYARTANNIPFNDLSYTLFSQDIFALPPYGFNNIWKGVVIVRPVDKITIRFTHVTNDNRNYAALNDDNHNHDAIEITYAVFDKLIVQAGYAQSRIIDLRRAMDTNNRDRQFAAHNNIYAQAKYTINRDQSFIVQFGEYGILQENLGMFGFLDPGMGWLTSRQGVLDTRSIVRLFYQGKF